jgi:hypothetical protein
MHDENQTGGQDDALVLLGDAIAKLNEGENATAVLLFARALATSPTPHVQSVTAYYLVSAGLYQDTIDLLRPYFHATLAPPELQTQVLTAAMGAGDVAMVEWLLAQLDKQNERSTYPDRMAARAWIDEVRTAQLTDQAMAAQHRHPARHAESPPNSTHAPTTDSPQAPPPEACQPPHYPWYSVLTDTVAGRSPLAVMGMAVVVILVVLAAVLGVSKVFTAHHGQSSTALPATGAIEVRQCRPALTDMIQSPSTPVDQYLLSPATGAPTAQGAINRAASLSNAGLVAVCPYLTSTAFHQIISQGAAMYGGKFPAKITNSVLNGWPTANQPTVQISSFTCSTGTCSAKVITSYAGDPTATSKYVFQVSRHGTAWYVTGVTSVR